MGIGALVIIMLECLDNITGIQHDGHAARGCTFR